MEKYFRSLSTCVLQTALQISLVILDLQCQGSSRFLDLFFTYGPRQANMVLIAYASSEGSGEPAHPRSLARTFAARSYKQ